MLSERTSKLHTRFLMILSAVVAITLFHVSTTCASMVVAPSKIVVNSNTNTDNFRKNNDNDNTVKAIIPYTLEENEAVIEDPGDITMKIDPKSDSDLISAFALRYCYVDENLIIEFEREVVENAVVDLRGSVDVIVEGTFYIEVQDEDGGSHEESRIIQEISSIYIYNPAAQK